MSFRINIYRMNSEGARLIMAELQTKNAKHFNSIVERIHERSASVSGKLGGKPYVFREMSIECHIGAGDGRSFDLGVFLRPGDWVAFP